jgi:hypothetical protein
MIENHLNRRLGDIDQGDGNLLALMTLRSPIHPDHLFQEIVNRLRVLRLLCFEGDSS